VPITVEELEVRAYAGRPAGFARGAPGFDVADRLQLD
jgi:hypothetical protein